MTALDVVSAVLLLAGTGLSLIAALGLHRFPDVFARMHAATKPATLGVVLTVVGAGLRLRQPGDIGKLGLVVLLQFLTVPVGSHLLARSAYRAGTELSPATSVDELADAGSDAAPGDRP